MASAPLGIRKRLQKFWHGLRMRRLAEDQDPGYREYLDEQLHRTLLKDDNQLRPHTKLLVEWLIEVTGELKGRRVLCIGARNGRELDYFESRGAGDVTAIDLFSSDPRIRVMDMHRLEFADTGFDIVYAAHSLEHSYDLTQVLAEIRRVLRPGGHLVVEMPIGFNTSGADRVDVGNAAGLSEAVGRAGLISMGVEQHERQSSRNSMPVSVARGIFRLAAADSSTE